MTFLFYKTVIQALFLSTDIELHLKKVIQTHWGLWKSNGAGSSAEPLRSVRGLASNQAHIEWHLTVLNQDCVPSIWCGRDWERLSVSAPGDFYIWDFYLCVRVSVCVDNDSICCARGTDEQVVWVGFSILSLPPIHTSTHHSLLLYLCMCVCLSVCLLGSLTLYFCVFLYIFFNEWIVYQFDVLHESHMEYRNFLSKLLL